MADEENIPDGDGDGGKPAATAMPPVDTNHRYFDSGGQPTPVLPAQKSEPAPVTTNTPAPQPDAPDKKLYDQLYKSQLYTKSYDDFHKQFNNPQSVDKLYQGLSDSQLYTKSKGDFYNQFFGHLPSQDVMDAHTTISNILNSPKANAAIDNITGNQFNQTQQQPSGKDNTRVVRPVPLRLPSQVEADRQNFVANSDDHSARQVLEEIKRQNVKNPVFGSKTVADPDLNKNIDAANYTLDATLRPHSETVVSHNINRIKSGDLTYDGTTKQLVKPEGAVPSLFRQMTEHSKAQDEYDFLTTHSQDDVIKHLEEKAANYDPDAPVYKPNGALASIAGMFGSNASQMAKLGAGSLAGRLAGASEPELSLPIAAITTMGVGSGIEDFFKTQYAQTLPQVYTELKNKNPNANPVDIYNEAKHQAQISAGLAMGQGIVMGELGGKKPEFNPVRYNDGFIPALKDIVKNGSKLVGSSAKNAIGPSALAAGAKAIENISQGKPATQDGGDAAAGNFMFMMGMGLLHAPGILTKGARANLMEGYSKAPEELVNGALTSHTMLGTMTPEEATATKQEITSHAALNDKKLDPFSPLNQDGKDLLESIENGNKPVLNKDLLKIASDNGIKPEEGQELTAKGIVEALQNKKRGAKLPDTFESDADKTTRLTSGLTGMNKTMADADPEGYLKTVADQVHLGNRETVLKGTGVTPELVDHATSKYPEHILADEPKSTTGGIPVESEPELRTLDYGDWKGKPESKESQDKIKQEILNNEPIGVSGEKLSDFANRVLPAAKKIMDNPDENTTIVTHSSVIKALNAWDEMGRPDKIDETNRTEFAEMYIAEKPEKRKAI